MTPIEIKHHTFKSTNEMIVVPPKLLRPYRPSEIATVLDMSYSTFRRRIASVSNLGKRIGHWYNIDQVKIIFNAFNIPWI